MASNPSQENKIASVNVKEVFYGSRHEHNLCLIEAHPRYTCSGCKAFGANKGFKCSSCSDFILHEACAALPDEYIHPFFSQQPLKFRPKTHLRHHCDGCGEVLRGFVFESPSRHLRLHPLCMTLPANLSYSGHKNHGLKLVVEEGKYNCTQCKKKNKKWKYQCEVTTCKVNLDMNCAIVDLHGMSQHGINLVQRPTRGKHMAKKVASGGKFVVKNIIEGLAEGVGFSIASEVFDEDEEEGGDNDEEAGEEEGGVGNEPTGS